MVSTAQKFVRSLLRSLGLKRKSAALLQAATLIPGVGSIALIGQIASWLGIAGLVHGAVTKNVSATSLSTIAAFFAGLEKVPQLAAYQPLIHSLLLLFSVFASGSILASLPKEVH